MIEKVKKLIPYLLILIILVGLFSPVMQVNAQAPADPAGNCLRPGIGVNPPITVTNIPKSVCEGSGGTWSATGTTPTPPVDPLVDCRLPNGSTTRVTTSACSGAGGTATSLPTTTVVGTPQEPQDTNGLGNNLPKCIGLSVGGFSVGGCLVNLFYYIFVALPSLLLYLAGLFFNTLVALTFENKLLTGSSFIPAAWRVVRDLSNIFFILVLLYIAIKLILGLGGHEVKKMISQVIIMALLINFSMFFTKIIIDTSNILALVFYNKINTETTLNGQEKVYVGATNATVEKDISGGLMDAFNPSKLLSKEFFDQAKKRTDIAPPGIGTYIAGSLIPVYGLYKIQGYFVPSYEVPIPLMLGIILISGLIMIFATYAFFIAGLAFLSRLIELWILIIFSPFAFMSSSIPKLSGVEYIGWDSWLKRLISVSFMAPIFMFFIYFIFLLINKGDIFGNLARAKLENQSTMETILFIVIPAMTILILLMKATEFAKKGSGKFGEVTMGLMKAAAVIGIGAATGGAALAGRAVVGGVAKNVVNANARAKSLKFEDTTKKWKTMNKKNPFSYIGLAGTAIKSTGKFATAGVAQGIHKTGLGAKIQEADKAVSEQKHATHILDAKTQSITGNKDDTYKGLSSEIEQSKVRKAVDKDQLAKSMYGASNFDNLRSSAERKTVDSIVEETYKKYDGDLENALKDLKVTKTAEVDIEYNNAVSAAKKLPSTKAEEAAIKEADNTKSEKMKEINGMEVKESAQHLMETAKTNKLLGDISQGLRKGSYDVRNIINAGVKNKSSGVSKTAVAVALGSALLMKTAFKKGAGVDYGTGKKDFFADLGNTISGALSHVKVDVGGLSSGGGGHSAGGGGKSDSHGGGGHH